MATDKLAQEINFIDFIFFIIEYIDFNLNKLYSG